MICSACSHVDISGLSLGYRACAVAGSASEQQTFEPAGQHSDSAADDRTLLLNPFDGFVAGDGSAWNSLRVAQGRVYAQNW